MVSWIIQYNNTSVQQYDSKSIRHYVFTILGTQNIGVALQQMISPVNL